MKAGYLKRTTLLMLVPPILAACGGGGDEGTGFGGISLSARASGATSIALSWSEPGGGVSVSPYIVARNDDISSSTIGSTTDRRYEVFGLAPSARYCFVIKNPVTRNAMSNTACATTNADTSLPSQPAGLTATAVSPAQIDLDWGNSSDNDRVDSYKVFRNGTFFMTVFGSIASDTEAAPNTEYCYTVSAVDPAGNESGQSAESCATTPADTQNPTTPERVRATYSESGGLPAVGIEWEASSDDGLVRYYRIFRDGEYLADAPYAFFDDTSPQADAGYCYTIVAVDAAGKESGESAPACVRVGWFKQTIGPSYVGEASVVTESSGIPNIVYKWGSVSGGYSLRRVRLQPGTAPNPETLAEGLETFFPQDAYKHAVAIDDSDLLHIAHKFNPEIFDEEIEYLQVSSGPPVRGSIAQSPDSLGNISLAVDSAGVVHACYLLDHVLYYATNTSGAWVSQQTSTLAAGADGRHCDIAVDSNGRIHISYLDSQGLAYLSDRSGSWTAELLDAHSGSSTSEWLPRTSIDVDSDGSVHIAFFHDSTDGFEYATDASGAWVTSIIDSGANVGSDCELALDGNGNAHVVYLDTSDTGLLKYATNSSGSWDAGFLADARAWFASIDVDSSGAAHVVYASTDRFLTYMTNADQN